MSFQSVDIENELASNKLTAAYQRLICQLLSPHLSQVFGYHALLYTKQAKELVGCDLVINHQVVINQSLKHADVVCKFEELPIASDTIDLVVLPNILQASTNPHQVLREVERVLIPEGVAIIVGRNPFSGKGLMAKYKQWKQSKKQASHDISRRRINDWFGLLGFESEKVISVSLTNQKIQQSQMPKWFKTLSQLICDLTGSYYVIISHKKTSTLTPIRPSWRKNKQFVPSRATEPSVKVQVDNWFEKLFDSTRD